MVDGTAREGRVYLHHRDGHRLPVLVRAGVIRDSDGAISGAVETFHDDSPGRERDRQLAEASRDALTDSLTGFANRRMLHHVLRHHVDEYQRYGRPFAVLFIDIDGFKRINDAWGHDTGDQVLRMVARTLDESTRPSDTVGRWGGEEFLLLAPAADVFEALSLAERTRRLVDSSWIANEDAGRLHVTVSVGVALARSGNPAARSSSGPMQRCSPPSATAETAATSGDALRRPAPMSARFAAVQGQYA
jgi:diguanylate cyclase (GGDEF)-like protein